MGHRTAREGHRVLVCAPFGRDAEALRRVLAEHGYDAACCDGVDELALAIDDHAGVALLTAEALRGDLARLHAAFAEQPSWSDLPFVILAARRAGSSRAEEAARAALGGLVGNPIVLERPIGSASLTSACASAMRSRQRQFEMRDRLRELEAERASLVAERASLEARVQERTSELTGEMGRRAGAEAALRQSQKMEAVGQLTGGIAHDFNNMLTGVIGSLELAKRRVAAGRLDDLGRLMDNAAASARRAAALTARLLAFSRRQSLDTKALDAGALLMSLEELLRRTIREDIALRIVPGEHLPHALADANQLESAVLNLAINARDAMPHGGQLTIEAREAELNEAYALARPDARPGRYVVVTVSDTGVGMSPEVAERAFDPFFTTKPVGEGTGLGLSMVYGFARQSGGHARIHSAPGVGTSVSIYLLAAEDKAAPQAAAAEGATPAGAGQWVLLVEDDPAVRELVREALRELGYRTVVAADAEAAIAILGSAQEIGIMVSDVGLPDMNGRQLAEVARQRRPGLPILFITGYGENAAIRAGFLGSNMAMVAKPFVIDELGAKVAEMLAAQGQGRPGHVR